MKEIEIQNAICDYLAIKRYFFWRSNTAPIYDTTKGAFRRMPKYAMKGVSDLILIQDGNPWFLEVKNETGRLSEDQKAFRDLVIEAGGQYEVVRSIDDVRALGL